MNHLHGIFPALVSAFDEHGHVDIAAMKALVEFQIEAGVHGLHPGGTTGEAPLMEISERKKISECVVEATEARVPVIVQVGHITTRGAIDLAKHAHQVGADAVSAVTPYYYTLPEQALATYFLDIARALPDDFPVYLYNIPQCTQNPVSPSLLAQVRKYAPNVRGLKHSEPNIEKLGSFLRTGGDVEVFVGSDGLILAGLAMGAIGAVSGNANVAPELFVRLYNAWKSGHIHEARGHQDRIAHIAHHLGNGGDLARFKEALARRGIQVGTVRKPLKALDDDGRAGVEAAMTLLKDAGIELQSI